MLHLLFSKIADAMAHGWTRGCTTRFVTPAYNLLVLFAPARPLCPVFCCMYTHRIHGAVCRYNAGPRGLDLEAGILTFSLSLSLSLSHTHTHFSPDWGCSCILWPGHFEAVHSWGLESLFGGAKEGTLLCPGRKIYC